MWNIYSKELWAKFSENSDKIECIALSPDGKTLISGSNNYDLVAWGVH